MVLNAGPGAYLFGEEEKKEVMDVLETGYLFRYGSEQDERFKKKVYSLEKEMERQLDIKHCIAVNSGTGALMASLAALGVGAGDEVIVPGYTFIASISSVIHVNAIPVLAEINDSLTIDPNDIEKKISERTKAVMAVHMLGNPANMGEILRIAKKHDLLVVEDCCQALGASYDGKKVGSLGNIGAFSLNNFKMATAGDGGAVCTNDSDLFDRAFAYHDQGHKANRSGVEIGQRSMLGMNMRMNELTGAVALAQIKKIDYILNTLRQKKRKFKDILQAANTDKFMFRTINDEGECASLLTIIFKKKETADRYCEKTGASTLSSSGWHVYSNMEQLIRRKTYSDAGCPFSCEKYNKEARYEKGMLPVTDDILSRTVNLSVGVVDKGLGAGMGINILSTNEEIEETANKIKKILEDI